MKTNKINKKGFATILFIILILMVFIVIAFFYYLKEDKPVIRSETETVQETVQDCGTDLNCFFSAFKECKPAKVKTRNVLNFTGFLAQEINDDVFVQIVGEKNEKCEAYQKVEKRTTVVNDFHIEEWRRAGSTDEEINERIAHVRTYGESVDEMFENTIQTCLYSKYENKYVVAAESLRKTLGQVITARDVAEALSGGQGGPCARVVAGGSSDINIGPNLEAGDSYLRCFDEGNRLIYECTYTSNYN